MLSNSARDELTGRIKSPAVLEAFDTLISGMTDLRTFELRPNVAGPKKAVHFVSGRVSHYALIANNQHLLWYFRRPGFRDGVFTWTQLYDEFPTLQKSKRRDEAQVEGTLKTASVAEARDVLRFVAQRGA